MYFFVKTIVFPKTIVFKKFIVLLTFVNDNPLLTIGNDDPSLTIVNIIVNKNYFQKRSFLKNNRIKNGHKSFLKNDRFLKRSLFVFQKYKTSGSFFKNDIFSKNETIVFENDWKTKQKRPFNNRFQKQLTTLVTALRK